MKLALPKGRLLPLTSSLLRDAGLDFEGYDATSRSYRPVCAGMPQLSTKVFNEKDIPIQVAVGNYDLGICGREWVEELLAKYPSSALVKVKDLGFGYSELCMAATVDQNMRSLDDLSGYNGLISIASEYPNLAEKFALQARLRRFRVLPLWGAAEAYPPDTSQLALISRTPGQAMHTGLISITSILDSSAFLIANRLSWETKDLSPVVGRLYHTSTMRDPEKVTSAGDSPLGPRFARGKVRLALADGHQQAPTLQFLARAGITLNEDVPDSRRPGINVDGVSVKIIRPQDMPLQVANGNFDLAITGEDWLANHLTRFPSSPVRKILTLGYGTVRIVAVVSNNLPVNSPEELRSLLTNGTMERLRIASEYTDIADRYAHENRLSPYRLIPTWGASEVFLPEDADLLIENVQTGKTLAENNLKIIDTLFESSACLIGRRELADDITVEQLAKVIKPLDQALKEA